LWSSLMKTFKPFLKTVFLNPDKGENPDNPKIDSKLIIAIVPLKYFIFT